MPDSKPDAAKAEKLETHNPADHPDYRDPEAVAVDEWNRPMDGSVDR